MVVRQPLFCAYVMLGTVLAVINFRLSPYPR